MKAYLHGRSRNAKTNTTSCYWTKSVLIKLAPMAHHKANLTWTASGYGKAIPSRWMVLYAGRWRRVYSTCYSNCSTEWIRRKGEEITVRLEQE